MAEIFSQTHQICFRYLEKSLTLSSVQSLSHVRFFATTWTIARQASLSMGFPRQEYWSGLPVPPPEDIPDPGIEPTSPVSPELAGRFFTLPILSYCLYLQQNNT